MVTAAIAFALWCSTPLGKALSQGPSILGHRPINVMEYLELRAYQYNFKSSKQATIRAIEDAATGPVHVAQLPGATGVYTSEGKYYVEINARPGKYYFDRKTEKGWILVSYVHDTHVVDMNDPLERLNESLKHPKKSHAAENGASLGSPPVNITLTCFAPQRSSMR